MRAIPLVFAIEENRSDQSANRETKIKEVKIFKIK
jgi:hypothetical protein